MRNPIIFSPENFLLVMLPETFLVISLTLLCIFLTYQDKKYGLLLLHTEFVRNTVLIIILITTILVQAIDIPFFFFRNVKQEHDLSLIFRHFLAACLFFCILMVADWYSQSKIKAWEQNLLVVFFFFGAVMIISSENLLVTFCGVQLTALINFIKSVLVVSDNASGEASLKYFVLNAFSTGLFLLGCSLIYGFTGTVDLGDIQLLFMAGDIPSHIFGGIVLGSTFITASLLFKIGASPFHMWVPDVYEGVPTPVTAFFAIIPKIALFALLIRLSLVLFSPIFFYWNQLIIFSALLSIIVGTLGALSQSKIKRLLAYSAISHVGFILLGISLITVEGITVTLFYIFIYLITSFNIFAVLLGLRKRGTNIEFKTISEFIVLLKSNKLLSINFCAMLFSIAGIPPLVGFYSKYFIFLTMIKNEAYLVTIIAAFFSVIAALYYIRLVKIMLFTKTEHWTFIAEMSKINSYIISSTLIFSLTFIYYPEAITVPINAVAMTVFA